MSDQIINKIKELLQDLDKITLDQSNKNENIKMIQRSLDDQMRDLELLDFDAYSFYKYLITESNFKDEFYGVNVIDLEDFQDKRRLLLTIIHPDKYKKYFKSDNNLLQEKAKDIMRKLIKKNYDWEKEIKENIQNLQQYQQGQSLIQVYQAKAKVFFSEANRLYKLCQNNLVPQFKVLEKQKNQAAKESFQFYREAMKLADKYKLIEQSIILRNNISLCFYLMKNYLLAQIYTTGSLRIIKKNKKILNRQQLFDDTIKVQNKIKGQQNKQCKQQQSDSNFQLMIQNSQNNLENINDLVLKQLNELKLQPYNQILMLRYEHSDECDIGNQLNFESTQVTRQKKLQTNIIKIKALALGFVPIVLDLSLLFIGGFGLFSFLSIPFIYINAKNNLQKYQKISKDFNRNLILRNELNKAIQEAIELHKQKDYFEFLKKLQIQINKKNEKLISIVEDQFLIVEYKHFIDVLLENGFRPDSVAYLLVLIGEAILFCDQFYSKYFTNQKEISMQIYKDVLMDKKLTKQAQDIDLQIEKLIVQNANKNNFFSNIINKIEKYSDCFDQDLKVDSKYSIAYYDIKEKKYQSYEKKVNQIKEFANINICLIYILNNQISEAKKALRTIISKAETYEFLDFQREYKISALKDFIQIFDTEFNSSVEEIQQITNGQQENQECVKIRALREYIQQEKFNQAVNQIYKITQEKKEQKIPKNFNDKLFYYWCVICYEKLNKLKEANFYIDKYISLPRKDQTQDQTIYQIQQKIQQ
ncbi:hypothetical protein ABPG72_007902 [Tetrahymena utriculariae]